MSGRRPLDRCRRRVQQDIHAHRGRKSHPLYSARRRTLHTGTDLLTDKKKQRLETLFATDEHLEVEANRGVYQPMIAAYREPRSGAVSSCDNHRLGQPRRFPPP